MFPTSSPRPCRRRPQRPSARNCRASSRSLRPPAATVLPDRLAVLTVVVPKIATTTVSRGDSLWRLSQLTYGAGTRYAVIYKANQEQIRNPNLIYPGQIFVVPAK